ncbi:hypothetical protein ACUTFY_24315 [Burkholderia pseudomallei]|uniref:hypothetical protein n=1 Tax=Burkholderia pseudomallei TaxID=28450 RepID=UPI000510680D|nr:hypothetical protein [Burkholderia pseudomallei]KGD28209.1 putative lipoprotein [Burkholderia pseudomallei]VBT32402.1 Uncharacterised protein [Burkholderia pseudomallei]
MRTRLALLMAATALSGCVVMPYDDYYAGYPVSASYSVYDDGYYGDGHYSRSDRSTTHRIDIQRDSDNGRHHPAPGMGQSGSGQSSSSTIVVPR